MTLRLGGCEFESGFLRKEWSDIPICPNQLPRGGGGVGSKENKVNFSCYMLHIRVKALPRVLYSKALYSTMKYTTELQRTV